jgi:hypothetical protein
MFKLPVFLGNVHLFILADGVCVLSLGAADFLIPVKKKGQAQLRRAAWGAALECLASTP